jgi:hypothetical protein
MTRTQIGIFAAAAIGAADGWLNGLPIASEGFRIIVLFGPTIVTLGVLFWWLRYDSIAHNYRRSPWFNVGIVAIAVVFVPIYLIRSRPPGARIRAVLGFLGVVAVYAGAAGVTHTIIYGAT